MTFDEPSSRDNLHLVALHGELMRYVPQGLTRFTRSLRCHDERGASRKVVGDRLVLLLEGQQARGDKHHVVGASSSECSRWGSKAKAAHRLLTPLANDAGDTLR